MTNCTTVRVPLQFVFRKFFLQNVENDISRVSPQLHHWVSCEWTNKEADIIENNDLINVAIF